MKTLNKLRKTISTIFLLICLPLFSENMFTTGSIIKNNENMNQLVSVFFNCLDLMSQLSGSRLDYFKKGLGWEGNGSYGFFTGNKTAFFNEKGAGFNVVNTDGEIIGQFYCDYSIETLWVSMHLYCNEIADITEDAIEYKKQSTESVNSLCVGFENNLPVMYDFRFNEGNRIFFTQDYILVTYPDEEYYYYLYNFKEPVLGLSEKISSKIFYQTGDTVSEGLILDDLKDDFPYTYFVRILSDAYKNRINIKDLQELSEFTINWFRNKSGLPSIYHNEFLENAAYNHAEYLIENEVIRRQMDWDINTVNLNDYLELHSETKGMLYFTGETVQDRTQYAGYNRNTGECVTIQKFDVISDNISWMHSIYHRRPYLDLRIIDFGHGHFHALSNPEEAAGVMNWGYDFYISDSNVYIYPYDGETLVPFAWSGYEAPDPFPQINHGLGVPVTVFFTDPRYKNGTLEILDSSGRTVSCLISSVNADRNYFIEVVPERPLLPGTEYTVKYSYGNDVVLSEFTTAPLNPAENTVNILKSGFEENLSDIGSFYFIDDGFDIANAMQLNNLKGELEQVQSGSSFQIIDHKYGFKFDVPSGWTLKERDWQEIALEKSWNSINFQVYAHGSNPDPLPVMENQKQHIEYNLENTLQKDTQYVNGYKLEYSWEYDKKVIIYCLIFNDYALVISGYGVTDYEMETVFSSFTGIN